MMNKLRLLVRHQLIGVLLMRRKRLLVDLEIVELMIQLRQMSTIIRNVTIATFTIAVVQESVHCTGFSFSAYDTCGSGKIERLARRARMVALLARSWKRVCTANLTANREQCESKWSG